MVGSVRHFLHGSSKDDKYLQDAIEADRTAQQNEATGQQMGKVIGRDRAQQQRVDENQAERTAEVGAGNRDERQRMHGAFEAKRETESNDKRFDEVEAAIAAETPGSHSDPRYQARIAAVEKDRKASNDATRTAAAAEQGERDRERDRRVGDVEKEGVADRMELGGDLRGAERARLGARLDKEQAAADASSPEEGKAFRAVADAERQQMQQRQDRERAERVGQAESETRADRMELTGDTRGAERERLEQRLTREQEEATRRDPKEGEAFRSQARAERERLEQRQAMEADRDMVETVDRVRDADTGAAEAALRAKGETYAADSVAFEREQQRKIAAINEVLAVTKDANERAKLEFALGLTKNYGDRDRQARADQHARVDREAAVDMRVGTEAEVLRGGGQGAEADRLACLFRDDRDIRDAERDRRPEDVAALRQRRDYDARDADLRVREEQRDRDRREQDAHYRATGQGAMADYNDLRDREQDQIHEAERSGDPTRVAQVKRTAADEITVWSADHRGRAAAYDGTLDYDRHILLGDANGNGLADALNRAGTDVRGLAGGRGNLTDDDRGARDVSAANASLAAVAAKLEELFENAPRLFMAG